MNSLDALLGHKLEAIYINADKTRIAFQTEVGPLVFLTYGDCCSHSWIEHVDGVRLKGWVTSVKDIEMPDDPASTEDNLIQVYSVRVGVGYFDFINIEFRNESNGYYGGSLNYEPGDCSDTFKLLTEDF